MYVLNTDEEYPWYKTKENNKKHNEMCLQEPSLVLDMACVQCAE